MLVYLYVLCIESNQPVWILTSDTVHLNEKSSTSIFIIFSCFAEILPFTVNRFVPSNSTAEHSLSHPNIPSEVLPSRNTFFFFLQLHRVYSFLDYIMGGCQIHFTVI